MKNTSLNIIKDSNVLATEDFQSLSEMKQELNTVFNTNQIFRTRTEMEVSVLDNIKFPTDDSKYWQAVREQSAMYNELVMLSYDYRKNLVEIKQLERKLATEEDDLEKELLIIDIEKKTFTSHNQGRSAKDRIRELKEWSDIKDGLKVEYSLEDCGEHQLTSYTQRWINQNLAMGTSGSPSEVQNLLGQLNSALTKCKQTGILEKVIEPFDDEVKDKIRKEYK